MRMILFSIFLALATLSPVSPAPATKKPFTPEDLIAQYRLDGVSVSPNGRLIVGLMKKHGLPAQVIIGNLESSEIYRTSLAPTTKNIKQVMWLANEPEFDTLGVVVDTETNSRLFGSVFRTGNYEAPISHFKIFTFSSHIDNVQFNVKAQKIAYTTITDVIHEAKDSGILYDSLFVRHWDSYNSTRGKSHIFTAQLSVLNLLSSIRLDNIVDVMQGSILESPVAPFGGQNDFTFSPDGFSIAFVTREPTRSQSWMTDTNIYLVSSNGGNAECLTRENEATDSAPRFSPDGKSLAWFAMARPQYEADRNQIVLYDLASRSQRNINEDWDRSPQSMVFTEDSKHLIVTAMERGREKIFKVSLENGAVHTLVSEGSNSGPIFRPGHSSMIFLSSSAICPFSLQKLDTMSGQIDEILGCDPDLEKFELRKPEFVQFPGWGGVAIQALLFKSINFDSSKKHPLALLIHGGPQGAFNDGFSLRWNYQPFLSKGYVVLAINPHGSTGYGQSFTDAVSKNWGGSPFIDIMKGVDWALKTYSWIDKDRMCALGASYGGYMVNWINGHTNRFACLVNHDGMFSTISAFYSTDELWFNEWEFGIPWDPKARVVYEKWNPERFVDQWRTPTLVIHGEKDYRLTVNEGLSTFTALQRRGISSKLLYFPDENHWVSNVENRLRWYTEVFKWLESNTEIPVSRDQSWRNPDDEGQFSIERFSIEN